MLYLNEKNILELGIDWNELIDQLEKAVKCLNADDFAQPIKPYLRYRNMKNRIIAMPAFLGEGFEISGIKWIASFPGNLERGLPRAHNVVVLNEAETGRPVCVFNCGLISTIRTAAVSGLMSRYFDDTRNLDKFNVGIIGFGPIGQYHAKMCKSLYGERLSKIYVYDLRKIDINSIDERESIEICDSWENVYRKSDIFITCTVSNGRYIDEVPKEGALLLNVSLRDFKEDIYEYVSGGIVVDDWEEVCRENTDIEAMHLNKGLKKEDVMSITDVVCDNSLGKLGENEPVMFNPMGMAVFDMAVASYYLEKAVSLNIGTELD